MRYSVPAGAARRASDGQNTNAAGDAGGASRAPSLVCLASLPRPTGPSFYFATQPDYAADYLSIALAGGDLSGTDPFFPRKWFDLIF